MTLSDQEWREEHHRATLVENRTYELIRELRREFPHLVRRCEHVKKMLADMGVPVESWHVYEPECGDCQKKEKR